MDELNNLFNENFDYAGDFISFVADVAKNAPMMSYLFIIFGFCIVVGTIVALTHIFGG